MSLQSARTSRLRHVRALAGTPNPALGGTLEPIDRVHLSRYTLGSPDLEREILGLFVAQLPLSIEQLRFAVTDREWQVAAHTIKGSARAVGAGQVGELALEAEQLPAVEDASERARILAALEEAAETVRAYVAGAFGPGASLA
ncbi:histidine kinase [Hyphomicrobium nitrativorans NL23]|uniref:Histidine kinase n=1 Tax=Hyphomicrobium nitrativorans NL23 TaxID=1029756 RepID=V5SFM5_9HYPH|nr:Hpt domain-containing protein [Hyphomicrobium nitrativorans]AHB48825.1 histidine kinase [Hyphomicrobium nitrativorans NL23]